MAANEWCRIPVPVAEDKDRRDLAGILTACGLEVRVVRTREGGKGVYKRYVEYREREEEETSA